MAADYRKMVADLLAFYDLEDKTILSVGAGGGQLVEYGRTARRVLALDSDEPALDKLRENLRSAGLEDKFEPVLADFFVADLKADVVLFEFSLHEMADPAAAVERARGLAPAVVVFDHGPGSPWSFIAGEENNVAAIWAALDRFPVIRTRMFEGTQVFGTYEELYQKVKGQGEPSLTRIDAYRGLTDIRIPMTYGLALIGGR